MKYYIINEDGMQQEVPVIKDQNHPPPYVCATPYKIITCANTEEESRQLVEQVLYRYGVAIKYIDNNKDSGKKPIIWEFN